MAASKTVKVTATITIIVTFIIAIALLILATTNNKQTSTNQPTPSNTILPVQSHTITDIEPVVIDEISSPIVSVDEIYQTKTFHRSVETLTNWELLSNEVDDSTVHTFHWLFPARNMDWAHTQLMEISNPESPRYGQWYSKEAIDMMTKPALVTINQVKNWLRTFNIIDEQILDVGHMLTVTTNIRTIENMFRTQMVEFVSQIDQKTTAIRCNGSYSIPQSLLPSYGHIAGLLEMPLQSELLQHNRTGGFSAPSVTATQGTRHRFRTLQTSTAINCGFTGNPTVVLPQTLAVAYNYTSRQTSTTLINNGRRTVIVTGVTSVNTTTECYLQSDATSYPTQVGYTQTPRIATTTSDASTQTLCQTSGPTIQSSTDMETLYSTIPTSVIGSFYNPTNGDIATIATAINAMSDANIPTVVVYNYFSSSDTDSSVPTADAALARLALRGVTFVVGAGIQGAPGPYNANCVSDTATGQRQGAPGSARMTAGYPASSPYVLSVGSTDFLTDTSFFQPNTYFTVGQTAGFPSMCQPCVNNDANNNNQFYCQKQLTREEGVNVFGSGNAYSAGLTTGGGFANYRTTADISWQRTAVDTYVNTQCNVDPLCTLPNSTFYNPTNRAFPDVSAYGGQFGNVMNSVLNVPIGQTSAAALWGGFISRLNEVSPTKLGFVNPLFYQMAARQPNTFNDITIGSNILSQQYFFTADNPSTSSSPCSGFQATTGWDPVTGLGSPNLGNMIAYLIRNPYNGGGNVIGDPVIKGFNGHSMQVHGTPFEHYNLISTPTMQYNAQFTFLNEGKCTKDLANRTACWAHTGTYLGEVAILLSGHGQQEVQIHVQAGSIDEGLYISINEEEILESSNNLYTHELFTLSFPTPFTATLTSDEYSITWQNSDQFLNQEVSMSKSLDNKINSFIQAQLAQGFKLLDISPALDLSQSFPHGLLGQSWSETHYENQWEWLQGNVDDYLLIDGLFGTQFVHNRYKNPSLKLNQ